MTIMRPPQQGHAGRKSCGRALPSQTRRTLIYCVAGHMERGEIEDARHLVLQALALDPSLSAEYIRDTALSGIGQ